MGVAESFSGTATYDPEASAMRQLPGPLTLTIMATLWSRRRCTFSGICRDVANEYKPLAASSVSSTLTRLIRRGWIRRIGTGLYEPVVSRSELILYVTELIDSY